MKTTLLAATAALLCSTAFLAHDARAASAGAAIERAELTDALVSRWGDAAALAHALPREQWAQEMAPAFAMAPLADLRGALNAAGYPDVATVLLGSTRAPRDAAAKALGDEASDLVYVALTPCRVLDTRIGDPIAAGGTIDVHVAQRTNFSSQGGQSFCNLPLDVPFAAAAINFTVVAPDADGYLTAFMAANGRPPTATLNYLAGDIRGDFAIVPVNTYDGASFPDMGVYSFARTHVVADLVGYFARPQATPLDCRSTLVTMPVLAGFGFNFEIPACPASYTLTGAGCNAPTTTTQVAWTISGLFHTGSGVGARCAGSNGSSQTLTITGTAQCCRIPGSEPPVPQPPMPLLAN